MDEEYYDIALLSSRTLSDKKVLEKHGQKILEFLKEYVKEDTVIVTGNIFKGGLIDFLEENNIKLTVKRQHPNSTGPSNKKYIRNSDITLFLHHNNSNNIKSFIEYVKDLDDKTYDVLELED